jgi:glutaredoxin-related protein
MEIIIYKVSGCSYCVKIEELMHRANVQYKTVHVGKDISRNEFSSMYPNATGFPYTIIDGNPVGGLVDVVKLFVEKKLVSSKKNE